MINNPNARISGSYNIDLDFQVIELRDEFVTIVLAGKKVHLREYDEGTINIPITVKPQEYDRD